MSKKSIPARIKWRIGYTIDKLKPYVEQMTKGIKVYLPKAYETPSKLIHVEMSGWQGLEKIISDIIRQSGIKNDRCLEFGVEYGFSSVAFSNYFKSVVGVDTFEGDIHAGFNGDIFPMVKEKLSLFENIKLIKSDYRDYIRGNEERFDLIHVDIIHTYEATYDCGLWAAQHSDCTIFHDTESFPEVKRAVYDIAKKTGKTFYNYPSCNGLGIVY